MKPPVREVTAGHEDEMFLYSKTLLGLPDTPVADYVHAEEGRERLRYGLLLPVTTFPAHAHGLTKTTVDGQRLGTSSDGMPIGVQLVANWHAESTILHIASLLESLSPVRDLHPAI